MLRALLAASAEIGDVATTAGKTVKEKVDFAQAKITALPDQATLGAREPQKIGDLLPDYLARLSVRWETRGGNLSTGFPDLDARINGGMVEGRLIIAAGRPGTGKTTLALQIAEHAADHGTPALVCSQEMSNTQLVDRALAALGRIPLRGTRAGDTKPGRTWASSPAPAPAPSAGLPSGSRPRCPFSRAQRSRNRPPAPSFRPVPARSDRGDAPTPSCRPRRPRRAPWV